MVANDPQSMAVTVVAQLPLLPLKDMVVYPRGVHPLFVGTGRSILALEAAMADARTVLLVARRDPDNDDPGAADLFGTGTVASVLQLLKLPDGTVKVLVEGRDRARITAIDNAGAYLSGSVELVEDGGVAEPDRGPLAAGLFAEFERYAQTRKAAKEVLEALSGIDDPGRLADTIAAHLPLKTGDRQTILETGDVQTRVDTLMKMFAEESAGPSTAGSQTDSPAGEGSAAPDEVVVELEKRIRGRVRKQMEKSQREYYLNEQIKAIQKELGELGEGGNEADVLAGRISAAAMSGEARERADGELSKLRLMPPLSAEATVVRSYIECLVNLPWRKRTRLRNDLAAAERILDEDHYGLEEVKERILDFLAVQKRVRKGRAPVLCLVGPPGVGKTSLGESIARATNRKFVRMALGGVRDEAEIRGHRRTYVGSMAGKILQKMTRAGVRNPLFLLDEVDKMGTDFRGDPASALLEVLDPEQNSAFNDHYLEVDYDLSEVLFICTSNSMDIPPALLDRLEIIRISGYTEDEKRNIARRYLVPRQLQANGIAADALDVTEAAIMQLIRYYTREAGVRSLEREIAKLARKVVREEVQQGPAPPSVIESGHIEHYNGVRRHDHGRREEHDRIGVVTGLAWTGVGGELLNIEAAAVPGKGRQIRTGSLGDVMQESIQTAVTVVRERADTLGISKDFHEKLDLHVHIPEGATPKDGPSAGVGMCTALISVLSGIPVLADVAMTGEITLRGQVLRIGGLKEKLLAAHGGGIRRVLIPADNERDLQEIPDKIREALDIIPVRWIDEILELALGQPPEALAGGRTVSGSSALVSSYASTQARLPVGSGLGD